MKVGETNKIEENDSSWIERSGGLKDEEHKEASSLRDLSVIYEHACVLRTTCRSTKFLINFDVKVQAMLQHKLIACRSLVR